MLRISHEQMAALGEDWAERFIPRAVAWLAELYPEPFGRWTPNEQHAFVSHWLDVADDGGVGTEEGVITCCELALWFGPEFHEQKLWADYLLFRCDLDADTRVARLRTYVPHA